MPFNPDEPMWRCKTCGESYHGRCVGKTVNEMRELQFICCSERMPTKDAMEKLNLSSATPEDSEEKPYSSFAATPEDEDMEVEPISGSADDEENSEMKTNISSAATHMVEEPISAYADDHEEDSEMQTDSSSAATSDVDEEDEDEDSKKKAIIDSILGVEDPKAKAMEMKHKSYTIPGTQIVVKARDCVYVRTSENDYTPRVAVIEFDFKPNYDIVDDNTEFWSLYDTVCMSVYCKPEDTIFGRKSFHGVDELFLLEKKENIKLNWILGVCRVQTLEHYATLTSDTTDEYYSRYTYDEQTQHLTVTPWFKEHVRCQCRMPYNPDMFMIQCIKCQEWFHPSCVQITVHHALELMGSFECPLDHPQSWKCNCNNRYPQSNMTECRQCNTFFHPACIGSTVEEMEELVIILNCSYHAESERRCVYCRIHCGEIEECARCGAEFHRHCLRNASAKVGQVLDCPFSC